ncbi:hypothetical protein [Novipirellula aureliae]|uniref:hypothetical protein n=1 Tax=Novipirellula aureliae TaxID=2527966 RepID=UPI0018CDA8DB|nr:hypothetical protein [Novipirellula aureliae]
MTQVPDTEETPKIAWGIENWHNTCRHAEASLQRKPKSVSIHDRIGKDVLKWTCYPLSLVLFCSRIEGDAGFCLSIQKDFVNSFEANSLGEWGGIESGSAFGGTPFLNFDGSITPRLPLAAWKWAG